MNSVNYLRALIDPSRAKIASRVAIIVGSILLVINHGLAFAQQQMTPSRWVSAGLSFVVPYLVNVHGQIQGRRLPLVDSPTSPSS